MTIIRILTEENNSRLKAKEKPDEKDIIHISDYYKPDNEQTRLVYDENGFYWNLPPAANDTSCKPKLFYADPMEYESLSYLLRERKFKENKDSSDKCDKEEPSIETIKAATSAIRCCPSHPMSFSSEGPAINYLRISDQFVKFKFYIETLKKHPNSLNLKKYIELRELLYPVFFYSYLEIRLYCGDQESANVFFDKFSHKLPKIQNDLQKWKTALEKEELKIVSALRNDKPNFYLSSTSLKCLDRFYKLGNLYMNYILQTNISIEKQDLDSRKENDFWLLFENFARNVNEETYEVFIDKYMKAVMEADPVSHKYFFSRGKKRKFNFTYNSDTALKRKKHNNESVLKDSSMNEKCPEAFCVDMESEQMEDLQNLYSKANIDDKLSDSEDDDTFTQNVPEIKMIPLKTNETVGATHPRPSEKKDLSELRHLFLTIRDQNLKSQGITELNLFVHDSGISAVDLNKEKTFMACGYKNSYLKISSLENNKASSVIKAHTESIYGISFVPKNIQPSKYDFVLTCSGDNTVKAWNVQKSTLWAEYEEHKGPVWDLDASSTVKNFVTASTGAAMFAYERPYPVQLFEADKKDIHNVRFSPDSKLVAAVTWEPSPQIRIFSAITGNCKRLMFESSRRENFSCLQFSPDGNLVISGDYDGWISAWDLRTGLLWGEIKAHDARILSISINSTGKVLTSGGLDGFVRTFRLRQTLEEIKPESYRFGKKFASFSKEYDTHSVVELVRFVHTPLGEFQVSVASSPRRISS